MSANRLAEARRKVFRERPAKYRCTAMVAPLLKSFRRLSLSDIERRLRQTACVKVKTSSSRTKSERYAAERANSDDDKRWRMPYDEKHKSNQGDPKISGGLYRTRPNRIVKRCPEQTDHRSVHAPHCRLCPSAAPEGIPKRQRAHEYQNAGEEDCN